MIKLLGRIIWMFMYLRRKSISLGTGKRMCFKDSKESKGMDLSWKSGFLDLFFRWNGAISRCQNSDSVWVDSNTGCKQENGPEDSGVVKSARVENKRHPRCLHWVSWERWLFAEIRTNSTCLHGIYILSAVIELLESLFIESLYTWLFRLLPVSGSLGFWNQSNCYS